MFFRNWSALSQPLRPKTLNAQGAEDEETGATGKVGKGKPDNTEAGGGTGADGATKDLANNEKADKTTKKKKGGEGTKKKKTK